MTLEHSPKAALYSELKLMLDYASRIYSEYLKSGKRFVFAKTLFDANQHISQLLLDNAFLLKENIHNDAIELMFHLDAWSAIWLEEFERQNPKLNDEFSFANEVNFPKDSVDRLLSSLKV